MSKSYRECESYAHLYSKQILKDWLISKWDEKELTGNYDIFTWFSPFTDEDRGIRLEYPIISRSISKNTEYYGMDPGWIEYPDLKKVVDSGRSISSVIDLVIMDHGKPKYGLEIVHKHECSRSKLITLAKLKLEYGFDVYEISATWILDQIRRPSSLSSLVKKN
jgi:hypothetical protein